MMPIANIVVKIIPIAASFFVLTFCCIHEIVIAQTNPAIDEPIKKPSVEYPTKRKAKKTPGRTACASASPIKDMFLKTIKQPSTPHIMPTKIDADKALIAQGDDNASNNSAT